MSLKESGQYEFQSGQQLSLLLIVFPMKRSGVLPIASVRFCYIHQKAFPLLRNAYHCWVTVVLNGDIGAAKIRCRRSS